MKSGVCPKCRGEKLYVIDEAQVEDFTSANSIYPACLTAHYGPSGETGWFGDKNKRVAVRFSVYVCASCAYSETYANNLDLLAKFAKSKLGKARELG